jgi:hypothetical protein
MSASRSLCRILGKTTFCPSTKERRENSCDLAQRQRYRQVGIVSSEVDIVLQIVFLGVLMRVHRVAQSSIHSVKYEPNAVRREVSPS